MGAETRQPAKAFTTYLALKWLLTGVQHHVVPESLWSFELLRAVTAQDWLYLAVAEHVLFHFRMAASCLATHRAPDCACVLAHVVAVRLFRRQDPVTLAAWVPFSVQVSAHVLLEVLLERKLLITDTTHGELLRWSIAVHYLVTIE